MVESFGGDGKIIKNISQGIILDKNLDKPMDPFVSGFFMILYIHYVTIHGLINGLICCKNGCSYWNRDVNGATNIYKIAYNAINNKERPNYLSRSKNLSGSLDELLKPKFTRSVKDKPC